MKQQKGLSISNGLMGRLKKHLIGPEKVFVGATENGYGVLCKNFIPKGEVIEEVLVPLERLANGNPAFQSYRFRGIEFAPGKYDKVMLLGTGCIYNHSEKPNINMIQNMNYERVVTIFATRDIHPGEELYLNYGYTPGKNGKKR